MIYISIIIGCIAGALVGMNAPIVSYTYSNYLAIAIIAALDSVFGGVVATIKKNFDIVFVGRMFTNLAIIRRYYLEKWTNMIENRKNKQQEKEEEKIEK